jgi:hypothetical protein
MFSSLGIKILLLDKMFSPGCYILPGNLILLDVFFSWNKNSSPG